MRHILYSSFSCKRVEQYQHLVVRTHNELKMNSLQVICPRRRMYINPLCYDITEVSMFYTYTITKYPYNY